MGLFNPVTSVATDHGRRAAVGMADGTVLVVVIGDELRRRVGFDHDGWVDALRFLGDGRLLLVH